MVIKTKYTIKSAWEFLKHTATLASHPIDSDLIGLGLHQGIDIFIKLLILMCFQGLRIIGLEGLRDEGFIQEKKTEGRGCPPTQRTVRKAKMRRTFSIGREEKTWVEWMECEGVLRMGIKD